METWKDLLLQIVLYNIFILVKIRNNYLITYLIDSKFHTCTVQNTKASEWIIFSLILKCARNNYFYISNSNYNVYHLRVRGSRLVFITLRTLRSLLWCPLLPLDGAGIKLPAFPFPFPALLLPRNFNLGSRDASTLASAPPWELEVSCLL